jgi:cytochrome c556
MHRPALLLTLLSGFAASAQAPAAPPNAVQREMQGLHELMVLSLVAIENDKVETIPEQIHKVHALKQETEKAITSGAWKPAQGGTVKEFVQQDEAFHKLLVQLLGASKRKDVQATTRALSTVLEGCTSCHVKFRFPLKAPAAK